jgi:hypothetical protein
MDVIGDFTPEDTAGYQKIKSIRILNWNKIHGVKKPAKTRR